MALVARARTAPCALLHAAGPTRRMTFEALVLLALARVLVGYEPMRRRRCHLNAGPAGGGSDAEGERVLVRAGGRIFIDDDLPGT